MIKGCDNIIKIHANNRFHIKPNIEHKIFGICMSETLFFPHYITKFDDFVNPYSNGKLSTDYGNQTLDSIFWRRDGSLVRIEHHSLMNKNLLMRNHQSFASLALKSQKNVYPFIFYTGELPVLKTDNLNESMSFTPYWFITKEIDGYDILKNLDYKIFENLELDMFDFYDWAWLPRSNIEMDYDELILAMSNIYLRMNAESRLLYTAKKILKLWARKYLSKERSREISDRLDNDFKGRFFERQQSGAYYANLRGGLKRNDGNMAHRARDEIIFNLLDYESPEEVSHKLRLPLETVFEIQRQKI